MTMRLLQWCAVFAAVGACRAIPGQESASSSTIQTEVVHPGDAFSLYGPWLGPLELPDVVRFRQLPMRMYIDPKLMPPPTLSALDDRMIPLFERALREATDIEIQEVAALSLAKVAREGLGDIGATFATLRTVMDSTVDDGVRHAAALALAESSLPVAPADLVRIASLGSDAERVIIERALARWKVPQAADLWRSRLPGRFESVSSVRLACEGLTALNDEQSLSQLATVLRSDSLEFGKRMAAAKAICTISSEMAFSEADELINGAVPDRLLAVALLDSPKAESHLKTERLCDDEADAVAAAAWLQLFRQSATSLVSHLPTGRVHRDAVIRMTAAQVIRQFPTAERASWLNEMLSDRHIEVRNTARRMLVLTADESRELRSGIVDLAAAALRPDSADWQGVEQSLVLLGQLQQTQFSVDCVPLLDHTRSEVMVSAAWLIHLYPDAAIKEPIVKQVEMLDAKLRETGVDTADPAEKQTLLFQYCGLLKYSEVQPILEKQFSKGVPGGADLRAAGMWAIGLIYERNPDPVVVAKFVERINDRNPMNPEVFEVRRMSVMALGLMRAKNALPDLQNAFQVDFPPSLIPGTVRWVLPLLGEPMPDDFPPYIQMVGSWRLMPADGQK